jgi:hypothetical protein
MSGDLRTIEGEAKVVVYAVGVVCASVCAPADWPREDVERAVNLDQPTGISSRWAISDDETFSGGEPNPSPCHDDNTRLHWLLNC